MDSVQGQNILKNYFYSASTLLVLLILFASSFYFLSSFLLPKTSSQPSPTPPSLLRGLPFKFPGPVLAASSSSLSLDGLTIIPLLHLPPIRISFPIPFSTYTVCIHLTPSASELVFTTLQIASLSFRALDAAREPVLLKLSGLNTNFVGNFAFACRFGLRDKDKKEVWTGRKWTTAGRVKTDLREARMSLSAQLVASEVEGDRSGTPLISVLSTLFHEGDESTFFLSSFPRPITLLNHIIPLLKQSRWGLEYPMKLVSNYIATEVLEGKGIGDVMDKIMELAAGHVDREMWAGMVDEERASEVLTPLDNEIPSHSPLPTCTSSPPPTSPPTDSICSSGSKEASTSALTTATAPPLPASPSTSTSFPINSDSTSRPNSFRLYAQLVAPTLLQNFPLPPFSPPLYRAGGAREKIQALNWVTGEIALKLYEAELSSIKFDEAKVVFEPSSSIFYPSSSYDSTMTSGRELLITLSDFHVLFNSHFNLSAPMSSLLAWTTGVSQLSSTGLCSTTLHAYSLQLRFLLLPTSSTSSTTSKSAFTLTSTSITPFTSITPVLTLASSSPLLKLGTDAVNALTKALSPQIAMGVSSVVGEIMKDKVRELLQGLLEGLEESVREKGGELPNAWRGS